MANRNDGAASSPLEDDSEQSLRFKQTAREICAGGSGIAFEGVIAVVVPTQKPSKSFGKDDT